VYDRSHENPKGIVEEETKGGKIVRDTHARSRMMHRGRNMGRHMRYTEKIS
jgi:hypothetical protein